MSRRMRTKTKPSYRILQISRIKSLLITFTVTDGSNLTAQRSTKITVNHVNRPPVLNEVQPQTVDENTPMTFNISGSDPDNDPLTFNGINFPTGAQIDQQSGVFTWTPGSNDSGTYQVTIEISDVIIYFIARRGYKKTGSEILQAEMQAWLINAVISGAIGLAFGATIMIQGTPLGWIARYIDQVLVIILSLIFIKDPIILIKKGLRELLLAAPQRDYSAPYEHKLLPLKDRLDAKDLALEVMKTGRRMWLTIRIEPEGETVEMRELLKIKEDLSALAREVYADTHTEVILGRI